MFRKTFAALLVALWVILSVLDLLEDLNLAGYAKLCRPKRPATVSLGQATKVANDNVETAYRTRSLTSGGLQPPLIKGVALHLAGEGSKSVKEDFKIYKFHCAFLL